MNEDKDVPCRCDAKGPARLSDKIKVPATGFLQRDREVMPTVAHLHCLPASFDLEVRPKLPPSGCDFQVRVARFSVEGRS